MRLLHIADLHLDRAFAGMTFVGCDGARRRNMLRRALEWAVDLALERKADVVTIGGDLFELEHVTADTAAFIQRQLSRLSCPVMVAAGNHDYAGPASPYRTQTWPANVKLAVAQALTRVDVADAVIWSLGYQGKDIDPRVISGFRVPEDDRAQILVVHGVDLSVFSSDLSWGGLGLRPADVRAMGFDHALLGHVHAGQVGELMSWPGSPVPLDPSETSGNHGAIWLEVAPGVAAIEPIAADIAHFTSVDIDVGGIADSTELEARARHDLEELPGAQRALVTCRLHGRRSMGLAVDAANIAAAVTDVVLGIRVLDSSSPEIALDELAREPNARGRALARLLEDGSDSALRAARLVVEAFEAELRLPV